jgi:8-oxo-dGTP diphosphatase
MENTESGKVLVFGKKIDSIAYIPRPGAYGILLNEKGLVASIQMNGRCFLPGGGLEPGESIQQCLKRELLEEVGCEFERAEPVGRADEYFKSLPEDAYYLGQGHFLLVPDFRIIAEPTDKTHTVLWQPPETVLARLVHLSQRWGLARALDRR